MAVKVRVNQSGVLIYIQSDNAQKKDSKVLTMLNTPRQSGTIGARGRMLVKRYCTLLGETILALRRDHAEYALENGYNAVFVTLTLPSAQTHNDSFMNRNLFGRFIVEARRNGYFNHYIWRAEVQKNGNVHWHILIDKEVNWLLIRTLWNKILDDNGYIKPYTEKMSQLTIHEYIEMRNCKDDSDYAKAINAHKVGELEGWSNPNTVDVQRVRSVQGMKRYVSKYMSKSGDAESRDFKSRHWGCSDSLRELREARENVHPSELVGIMNTANNLDLEITSMEHCTYIRCNEEELRLLNTGWYELLGEVERYNVFQLFREFAVQTVKELNEDMRLSEYELGALLMTVKESQLELAFNSLG